MASLVIVHHSYALLGIVAPNMFVRVTGGQLDLGDFAVGSFFIISGFLVSQSLLNSRTLTQYFAKRFLRLFPALFTSLILSALLLGPIITNQSLSEYFMGTQGTSPLRFVFLNVTLNIFGYDYRIRDLFAHNPFPYSVNGSIWTLKHEFASYVILAALFMVGALKRPKFLLAITGFVGCAYIAYSTKDIYLFKNITTTWWIFHAVEYPYFLKLLWLFLIGAITYIYREKIIVSTKILMLVICILLVSMKLGYLFFAWHLFFPYVLISMAVLMPLSWFSKYGDFSYGIYIYAFPVQQALALLFYPHISVRLMMLYSFLVTLLISIVSWLLVEKPALRLKKKFAY
jgi:peptidoglycan/LPS O-acetylase OafA/YrhL